MACSTEPSRTRCQRFPKPSSLLAVILVGLAVRSGGVAADVDYLRDIKPLLRARCYACHGTLKRKARLRLDTALAIRAGGRGGAAVEPGEPQASLLIERVTATDPDERMPPEGQPLSPEQIDSLRRWIVAGAPAPPDEKAEASVEEHWAFRPPRRTPTDSTAARVAKKPDGEAAHPIDALLDVERRRHGIEPLPLEDRRLLLRRVHLDLVGLPPTPREQREFLDDASPDAWERVVDRLLASPRHGERWGRHWMDVWRYTDWYGLGAQLRNSQKHIWRWRDWIVESLNDDKGYDRMVLEMLAADELYPSDPDAVRGTGFLARNYYLFNRTTWLDTTIEHTSKALLGLTMNCAKCHDHKYDPITQVDYYRMRAFFEPHQVRLDSVPGETDLEKDGMPRVFDAHLDAPTYLHVRGDAKSPDRARPLTPCVQWRRRQSRPQARRPSPRCSSSRTPSRSRARTSGRSGRASGRIATDSSRRIACRPSARTCERGRIIPPTSRPACDSESPAGRSGCRSASRSTPWTAARRSST